MITEFAIAATIVHTFRWFKDAPKREISKKFDDTVYAADLANKTGANFKLKKIEKTDYGYTALISIPAGKDIGKLQSVKDAIETKLKAIVEINKDDFEDYAKIKIVTTPLNTRNYEPVKTKSHELFIGYKLDGTPYIIDLNKDPHILFAGKTGTGKSFEFASTLTNSIYFNSKEIEIYLFQIMKGEIDIFKDCPSVKFTSDDPKDILVILKNLCETIHSRSKRFTEHGIKNISQWNKHFPKKRMKRILIGAEEISFFMKKDESDNNPFFKYFIDIVKAGRSVGIHFIGVTQRTTVANLGGNGELKSQVSVITAQQRNETDSRNAIDIPDAANLRQQEFIASANDGYVRFKAPWIDEDYKVLNKYVPEIRTPAITLKKDNKIKTYNAVLNYEESQKLKTHAEFYILGKDEANENNDCVIEIKQPEVIVDSPESTKKRSRKRSGVISLQEVKDVKQD